MFGTIVKVLKLVNNYRK